MQSIVALVCLCVCFLISYCTPFVKIVAQTGEYAGVSNGSSFELNTMSPTALSVEGTNPAAGGQAPVKIRSGFSKWFHEVDNTYIKKWFGGKDLRGRTSSDAVSDALGLGGMSSFSCSSYSVPQLCRGCFVVVVVTATNSVLAQSSAFSAAFNPDTSPRLDYVQFNEEAHSPRPTGMRPAIGQNTP